MVDHVTILSREVYKYILYVDKLTFLIKINISDFRKENGDEEYVSSVKADEIPDVPMPKFLYRGSPKRSLYMLYLKDINDSYVILFSSVVFMH